MPTSTRPVRPLTAILTVALLAACARQGGIEPTNTAPARPDPSVTASQRPTPSMRPIATVPPSQPGVVGEVPDAILEPILVDARDRLNTDDVTVLVGEAVTWPDGSLGCPEPGMMYTQALVDGFKVVVTDGTTQLDYRVGNAGTFLLCEKGRPAAP